MDIPARRYPTAPAGGVAVGPSLGSCFLSMWQTPAHPASLGRIESEQQEMFPRGTESEEKNFAPETGFEPVTR